MDDFLDYCDNQDKNENKPQQISGLFLVKEYVFLSKTDMVAMLSVLGNDEMGLVTQSDPRSNAPKGNISNSLEEAIEKYEGFIKDSEANGWKVIHRGLPNFG